MSYSDDDFILHLSSLTLLTTLIILISVTDLTAAPKADLWDYWTEHDPSSTVVIDHSEWDNFLKEYLITDSRDGIYKMPYVRVSEADSARLGGYIRKLESVKVSTLNRAEQLAYWINLYNAATVALVLEHYPVESIREIYGGLFKTGPWDEQILEVEGESVTLNDIEHRIIRPIWQDHRIHYLVNCAGIGCPNLWPEALTGRNVDDALRWAAVEYINHPRGVSVDGDRIEASSIFDWYRFDFVDEEEALPEYWLQYAEVSLAAELRPLRNARRLRIRYDYDWSLNEP